MEGNNMRIYEAVRSVPQSALKEIKGGKLKGFTDINPMWRIKTMTEQFGPCGIGWKYTIDKQWLEPGYNGTVKAYVNLSLYIKVDGEWSDAIPGTGGSSYISAESGSLYTDDECYKKALTDAISVACKALGVGADIYWEGDRTKYSQTSPAAEQTSPAANNLSSGTAGNGGTTAAELPGTVAQQPGTVAQPAAQQQQPQEVDMNYAEALLKTIEEAVKSDDIMQLMRSIEGKPERVFVYRRALERYNDLKRQGK